MGESAVSPAANILEFRYGGGDCRRRGAQLTGDVSDIGQRRGTALVRLFWPALLQTVLDFGDAVA